MSFNLADFLLSKISYRLPRHLYTYVKGITPLSTDTSVLAALVLYLVIIFSIQGFLKNRKPHKLTTLFQTHNILLSSGSLLVLALILEEVVPILWKHGLHYAICAESAWTPVSTVDIHTRDLVRSDFVSGYRDWNSTT
jgi:fatty acid elongase 3